MSDRYGRPPYPNAGRATYAELADQAAAQDKDPRQLELLDFARPENNGVPVVRSAIKEGH